MSRRMSLGSNSMNLEEPTIKMQTNYLTMDKDDLIRSGIKGNRLKLSLLLSSKRYDIVQIVLVVIYLVLMVVTFLLEDFIEGGNSKNCDTELQTAGTTAGTTDTDSLSIAKQSPTYLALVLTEVVILFLFCIDIVLHVCGYGFIYLQDWRNMVDAVVILLNIVFVVAESFVDNQIVRDILKLRGFFRLIRILVLMRKVTQVNAKRERRRKFSRLAISDTLELKTVQ